MLTVLIFSLAIYCTAWIFYARQLHALKGVPGPWLASISRCWILHATWRGDMDRRQRELHRVYGQLVRIAPNECICSDPRAIDQLYRTRHPLSKSDFYPAWHDNLFSKYPDNFTVTDERLHAERRRIVNHVYSLSNVLRAEARIDECLSLFLQRLEQAASGQMTLDLGEWLQWYAFDVIGQLYFGRMFGFMHQSHDHKDYIASLNTLVPLLCLSGVAPTYVRPLRFLLAVFSTSVRRALKAIDHIATAARDCVNDRVLEIAADPKKGREDVLQQLLELSYDKGDRVDFQIPEVQTEVYVALFAGSDTTAIALRAVFYYLMKSPAAYEKLQLELDDAVTQGKLSSPVKFAEAVQLPFLDACIKEAMRLHPSVGLALPRVTPVEGLTLNGYFIPAGYRVGMNAAVVQRDPGVFGAQAAEFIPDRWLQGRNKEMDRCMLNFGAGTRTCIGKNISLSEIYKLVPSLLVDFRLRLVDPDSQWVTKNMWFNKQTGLTVTISRRTERST